MYEGESRNLENLNDSKENPQDSNLELSDSEGSIHSFAVFFWQINAGEIRSCYDLNWVNMLLTCPLTQKKWAYSRTIA